MESAKEIADRLGMTAEQVAMMIELEDASSEEVKEETFEERLDKLFSEAIDVHDTVWYSDSETLRDAILRVYQERIYEIFG